MLTTWNAYSERHPEAGERIADVLLGGLRKIKDEHAHALVAPDAVSVDTLQQWYSALKHVPIAHRIEATRLLGLALMAHDDVANLQNVLWEFVPMLKRPVTRALMQDLCMACVDKMLDIRENRAQVVRAATALFEQTPAPSRQGEQTFALIQANLFLAQLECSLESEAVATITRLYSNGCDLKACEAQIGAAFGALPQSEQDRLLPMLSQVVLTTASEQPPVVRLAGHVLRAHAPEDALMWILALHPFCHSIPERPLGNGLQVALGNADALRDFETKLDAIFAAGGAEQLQRDTPLPALLHAYLAAADGKDSRRIERVHAWLGQAMGDTLSASTTANDAMHLGVLATFVQLIPALWAGASEKERKQHIGWLSEGLIAFDSAGGHLRLLARASEAVPDAGRTMVLSMLRRMNTLAKTDIAGAQAMCTRIVYFAAQTLAPRGGGDLAAAEMALLLLTKSMSAFSADAKSFVAHWIDNLMGWFAPESVAKLRDALADANLAAVVKEPYPQHVDGPTWHDWMEKTHPPALTYAQGVAFFDELKALQAVGVSVRDLSHSALTQFHYMFSRKFRDDGLREQVRLTFEATLQDTDKSLGPRGQMNIAHLVVYPTRAVSHLTPAEFSTYMRLCATRFYTDEDRELCQKRADFVIGNTHPQAFEADSEIYNRVVQRFKSLAAAKGAGNKAWADKILAQLAAARRPSAKS